MAKIKKADTHAHAHAHTHHTPHAQCTHALTIIQFYP